MSTENTHSDNDPQLQSVLRELDRDAAVVDHEALRRIRDLARRERTGSSAAAPYESQSPAGPVSRALATLFSAVAVLLIAVSFPGSQADERPSLGTLLADFDASSRAVLEVQQDGAQTTIEFQRPGTVTWRDDDTHYRIADGHQLWKVTSLPQQDPRIEVERSPLPAEGLTALRLLQLGDLDLNALERVQVSGAERWRSVRCNVYQADIRFDDQPAQLKAFAGADDGRLKGLRVVDRTSAQRVLAEVNIRTDDSGMVRGADQLRTSLRDDGRIGQLTDVHGLVFVRSFPGHRWTPASPATPLYVGDQIRCESVGAHAAVVRLTDGSQLTVGPGTQLGLGPENTLQLQRGDLRVQPSETPAADSQPLSVQPRTGEAVAVNGQTLLRIAADGTAVPLDIVPAWMTTLDESMTSESLGSLVAQVDGRDVSLTMGFHHVTVEIRDQIARTVIEESFVNNTNQRLEGVFHFPLPHDASISGFGMWIGDQLVEADIVEKQRARQIYETILREKRDPGLLEWEGGNIFKARVFPIEPHREKKIRIVYTQTLPLQNGTFRYTYPLRSDLLQKTPLRDLTIDVLLHSEVGVGHFHSPSHPTADVQATDHSASLNYTAQNITPQRDFELTCRLAKDQPDVVAIPHIRGDDGYFMLQLSPPAVGAGNWSRTLVRDGTPLDVILLCDTSLSMDPVARGQQADLLAAVLGSLSEADKVRVACCDSQIQWLISEPLSVTDEVRKNTVTAVRERLSLGWSSLQPALRQAVGLAEKNTQIIYIGDGTVVAESATAVNELTTWLGQLASSDRLVRSRSKGIRSTAVPTIHGIAVGNAFDMNVIRAMGRVGRGTSRAVSSARSPQDVARQLLFEITRPGLKNLQVKFRNVDVAAVYPSELPNLADGMQHIITGRFRPGADDAGAEVVVTGTRGGEQVTYVARMPLDVAERPRQEGDPLTAAVSDQNSFIPRLWAKAHLDQLLLESPTDEVRKRIVRLSQTYHLMTPYTSLLVLESDADRERFGVQKSQLMRDGEEFFAAGREEAEYSLRQKQLAVARAYRQRLYDQFIRQIETMRSLPLVQMPVSTRLSRRSRLGEYENRFGDVGGLGVPADSLRRYDGRGQLGYWGMNVSNGRVLTEDTYFDQTQWFDQSIRLGDDFGIVDEFRFMPLSKSRGLSRGRGAWDVDAMGLELTRGSVDGKGMSLRGVQGNFEADGLQLLSRDFGRDAAGRYRMESLDYNESFKRLAPAVEFEAAGWESLGRRAKFVAPVAAVPIQMGGRGFGRQNHYYKADAADFFGEYVTEGRVNYTGKQLEQGRLPLPQIEPQTFGVQDVAPVHAVIRDAIAWPGNLQQLFPGVIHAHRWKPAQPRKRDPLSDWPQEVADALQLLDVSLQSMSQAVQMTQTTTQWHAGSGESLSSRTRIVDWAAKAGWLMQSADQRGPIWQWSLGKDGGAWLPAFRTGRRIEHPEPPENAVCPIPVPGRSMAFLEAAAWSGWSARMKSENGDLVVIELTSRREPWKQRQLTIDTNKRCLLKQDDLRDGRITARTQYTQHVQIGTVWVPRLITSSSRQALTGELARQSSVELKWKTESPAQMTRRLRQMLPAAADGLQLHGRLPSPAKALAAVQQGSASFEQKFVRVLQLIQREQWGDAFTVLNDAIEAHYAGQNTAWLRWELLKISDRLTDLRGELPGATAQAVQPELAGVGDDPQLQLAVLLRINGYQESCLSEDDYQPWLQLMNEQLNHLNAPADLQISFANKRVAWLDAQGRHSEADEQRRAISKRWPFRYGPAEAVVTGLVGHADDKDVTAAYKKLTGDSQRWTGSEWNRAFKKYVAWLRSTGEFQAGLKISGQWSRKCGYNTETWSSVLRSHVEVNAPDQTRALRDEWIALWDGRLLPDVENAQFMAAFYFGLGRLGGLSLAGPQMEIREPLLQIGEQAAQQERQFSLAMQVLGDRAISRTPAGQAALKRVLASLAKDMVDFAPTADAPVVYRLQTIFSWLQQSGISGCDEHEALLTSLRQVLDRSAGELTAEQLTLILQTWGVGFDEHTTKQQRQAWQSALQKRWQQTDDQRTRDQLAAVLRAFESSAFDAEHQLAWHRFYRQHCRPERAQAAIDQLFGHLLTMPWSQPRETETWQLIDALIDAMADDGNDVDELTDEQRDLQRRLIGWQQLIARSSAIRRWSAAMLTGRVKADQAADDSWDERDRAQQTTLNKRFQVVAVRALLTFLQQQVDPADADTPADIRLLTDSAQLQIHNLNLMKQLLQSDVTAGVSVQDKADLRAAICRQIGDLLTDQPQSTPDPAAERDAAQQLATTLSVVSRHWLFANWLHQVFERDDEGELNRLLTYVRAGQQIDTVTPRAWRAAEFGILLAADRPIELEQLLRDWMDEDDADAPWRRHLGHLLAELDRVEEAVALYETAGTSDRLSVADWKQLAVWQHTLDRRADKEESERQAWQHMPLEARLQQLQAELRSWQNNTSGRTPTAPTDVVKRLQQVATSAHQSTTVVHVMMEWYKATHDPLVLKSIGQTVLGRTSSTVFDMLSHTQGTLRGVDQEAGYDSVYASIRRVEQELQADTTRSAEQLAVDRLGLQLLKLQTAISGSRQSDQPHAHGRLALQVIDELAARKWTLKFAPLLAQCLTNMGVSQDTPLKARRVALIEDLLDLTERGSEERLRIAMSLAGALQHDGDNERRRQVLEASLRQHLTRATTWSGNATRNLSLLQTLLQQQRRYRNADQILRDCQQARPGVDFSDKIWSLRIAALRHGGSTLAGEGEELYAFLRDQVTDNVYRPKRHRLFAAAWTRLLEAIQAGAEANVGLVRADVRQLREFMPTLLRRHSDLHQELINAVFRQLAQFVGRREGIMFLVDQLNAEPVALQWTKPRAVFHATGEQLFRYSYEWDKKAEVYRLYASLAPVRTQLEDALFFGFEAGLQARDDKHRGLFGVDHTSAYRNGRNRIVAALVDCARQHADSQPHMDFLLNFHRREWRNQPLVAIQILEAAMETARLSDNLRVRHIDLLMQSGQHQRAFGLLAPLQEKWPLRQDLRQRTMTCLSQLDQRERLKQEYEYVITKIIDVPEASWNTLSSFAWHCRTCSLWAEAASLYDTAIDRYGEPQTVDNQLSSMTQQYAECLQQLGETNRALDMISSSWVYAGSNPSRRNEIRRTLENILESAADLDAAAQHIAARAAESGEESSFLRRALGKSFVDAGQGAKAVEHLQLAIELQPADEQARRWLVAAFDQTGDARAAISTLRDLLESSPRSIATCRELSERFAALGDSVNAERAATSIVESAPAEAEHQIQLAELREDAELWAAAITHWQRAVSQRSEDPTPLIRLATVQFRHGDRRAARAHLKTLLNTDWDKRFEQLPEQLEELKRLLSR